MLHIWSEAFMTVYNDILGNQQPWSLCLTFQRLCPSPLSGVDMTSVVFTCCIYTQSCHSSQPEQYGEHWAKSHGQWYLVPVQQTWGTIGQLSEFMFVAGYHEWLRGNPISLLKLWIFSQISMASLTKRSCSLSFLLVPRCPWSLFDAVSCFNIHLI
jgi:hypothetical protein